MVKDNCFLLIDFDGVIAQSFDAAFSVNQMLCPGILKADYLKRFEGNINDWKKVPEGHSIACRHDIDFMEVYVPKMKNEVALFPGIAEVLRSLSSLYTLIVVSSTITSPIKEFLSTHSLLNYFTEVMGNDIHKSKIEKMKMVFVKYKTDAAHCVFITDTLGDLREASHVGVRALAVTWGFHDAATLAMGNPFCVINTSQELAFGITDCFAK